MTTIGSQVDGARDQVMMMRDLAAALSQAIGGCSQLTHNMGGDPRWLMIRESLELTKEGIMEMTKVQTMIVKPKVVV